MIAAVRGLAILVILSCAAALLFAIQGDNEAANAVPFLGMSFAGASEAILQAFISLGAVVVYFVLVILWNIAARHRRDAAWAATTAWVLVGTLAAYGAEYVVLQIVPDAILHGIFGGAWDRRFYPWLAGVFVPLVAGVFLSIRYIISTEQRNTEALLRTKAPQGSSSAM